MKTAIVDLRTSRIEISETPIETLRQFLGGRGLGARLLFDLVGPGVEPLSPDNYLIFTAGPLVGTPWPTSARLHVTYKSPLTGVYGYANSGGFFAAEMRHAGYDAILVTGRAPDFKLTSLVNHPSVKSVNINPFSTLIVESARSMPGGLSDENVSAARQHVMQQLNFGLNPRLITDPIGTVIEDGNVAVMVKASEALGEMIRRTADRLRSAGLAVNADQVVAAISHDLVDGIVDGVGGTDADSRIAALATLASAQVLVEALSNNLRVDHVHDHAERSQPPFVLCC